MEGSESIRKRDILGRSSNKEASGLEQKEYDLEPGITLTVDLNSSKPIYMQIFDSVVTQIAMGLLSPEDRLPSSRSLSAVLGVNYHTVNRAYSSLIQEGYVTLDRRKRIIVNEIPKDKLKDFDEVWLERMRILILEAMSKGFTSDAIINKIGSILDHIVAMKDE